MLIEASINKAYGFFYLIKDIQLMEFLLNPEITFLNFGSFGACPKEIFQEYQKNQLEFERNPVHFMIDEGVRRLGEARTKLANYIGANSDEVVFTTNPTYAINIIAKSLQLQPGDEILTTDLEYGAMDRTWEFYCSPKLVKYIKQHIGLPIVSKEQILEDFWKGFSKNTKVVFISQITSATALILPVEEICEEAKKRGLITIVDGAHVPAQIPLDLSKLKADIYTGACHKWMMGPKGAAFLYVKKELQNGFDPLVVSWGYKSENPSNSQFIDYHQLNGTRDYSAFLTVPYVIDFLDRNNWTDVALKNREWNIDLLSNLKDEFKFEPISPIDKEFLGQMGLIPIKSSDSLSLKKELFENYKIEIPVTDNNGELFLRYSVQVFNRQSDFDKLISVLHELKKSQKILF